MRTINVNVKMFLVLLRERQEYGTLIKRYPSKKYIYVTLKLILFEHERIFKLN